MTRSPLMIRVDASPEIGSGHVMRMLALAQAWQLRGGCVSMLSAAFPEKLAERFHDEQIDVLRLVPKTVVGSKQDARQTLDIAKQLGAKWIVADGYHFGEEFQTSVGDSKLYCAVVTDFDFCESWHCDLILNQNPHASQEAYVSPQELCQRLLGTHFALLRQEFLTALPGTPASERHQSKRLLVTFGGSDPPNATTRILELLELCECEPLAIRVLVGAVNPHREAIKKTADKSRHHIELLTNVRDMPEQYLWADAIVSAGGSSCWEWLYFGLRGAILAIAENQLPIYEELTSNNSAIGLGGMEPTEANDVVARHSLQRLLAGLPDVRKHDQYRHLVDGHGAYRVAAKLDTDIWLRPANSDDCPIYFDWANDPVVRSNSLNSNDIEWNQHCEWFDRELNSTDTLMLVGMRDEIPVGQIRFTYSNAAWNVSFSVAGNARGAGVGKELLRLGTAWMAYHKLSPLTATVKKGNPASARCFTQQDWEEVTSASSDLLQFQKSI